MDAYTYRHAEVACEALPLSTLADAVGTPAFVAKDREMPRVEKGDVLAVMSGGAYGFVQAPNYNCRPRAPEVLVDGDRYAVVRRRETYEDLVAGEETS